MGEELNELSLLKVVREVTPELSNEEKYELQLKRDSDELKRYEFQSSISRVMEQVNSAISKMVVDADPHVKLILAMNDCFGRLQNQALAYPLTNLIQYLQVNDLTLFNENMFTFQDKENGYDQAKAYLRLNAVDLFDTEVSLLTLADNVMNSFKSQRIDAELLVYVNINDYHEHKASVVRLEEEVFSIYPGRVVSMIADSDVKDQADIIISDKSTISFNQLMNSSILRSIGASSKNPDLKSLHRQSLAKFYFEPGFIKKIDHIEMFDFYLLAKNEMPNLITNISGDYSDAENRVKELEHLAKRASEWWFDFGNTYKFDYEIIEDFFNAPNLVHLPGLTSIYGLIETREIRVEGFYVDKETFSERPLEDNYKLNSTNFELVTGVMEEDLLRNAMKHSKKNLRPKMIIAGDRLIRITKMYPKLTIIGTNKNRDYNGRFEITDFSSIRLLAPYYNGALYNFYKENVKGLKEYKLPERFKLYLKRLASKNSYSIEQLDTKWFSKENYYLPEVLNVIDQNLNLDYVIQQYVSPMDGLLSAEITLSLEELLCHTTQK